MLSLVLAASNNHAKLFQWLMEQDGTKEYPNLDRVLAFCFQRACSNGCVDMVPTLVDMNVIDPAENVNAGLRYAVGAGHLDIVKILVDLDSVMDAGLEEVFQAALNGGNLDIVKLLVEDCEVDPDCYDNLGIQIVAEKGQIEVMRYLMLYEN
ncbi:hypothetical protein HDU76_005197, partial [Blyttiomyces sp. JEL0837]